MKLQIKVGQHEFSIECADGDLAYADKKLAEFQKLLLAYLAANSSRSSASVSTKGVVQRQFNLQDRARLCNTIDKGRYKQIFQITDGVLWAQIEKCLWETMSPDAIAMALMLGHFALTPASSVTATDLRASIELSGGSIDRVDRCLQSAVVRGCLRPTGLKRGTRYALTMTGIEEAIRTFEVLENAIKRQIEVTHEKSATVTA